jgi:hypothetical protein
MSRIGIILLAGVLAWTAAPCRADETADSQSQEATPERVAPTPAPDSTPAQNGVGEAVPTTPAALVADVHTDHGTVVSSECASDACCHGGLTGWISQHTHGCQCARRFWDWLTYYPGSCPRWCSHCGCTVAPTCTPPLYTYFLWHCDAAHGGCCGANGHHAPAPTTAVTPAANGMVTEGTAVTEEAPTETPAPAPQ